MTARVLDLSVYLVTDRALAEECGDADGRSLAEVVDAAVTGGATIVQLRDPAADAASLVAAAIELSAVIDGRALFVVDDRVDVVLAARRAGARVDGVHLGQSDLPVEAARALLGPGAIVGLTANTREHLEAATALPAGTVDYLGVGVIRPTSTKADHPEPLGIDGFAAFAARSPLPCVAIGGIVEADVPALVAAGAAGTAVVSAICAAPQPRAAAAGFAARWREAAASAAPSASARLTSAPASARPATAPPASAPPTSADAAAHADRALFARPLGARGRAVPRVLSIAGTDPTGGAGIQADLKSIAALGGYGMAVVTALVAQNTRGVRSVHLSPVDFLREQLEAVSDDVEIDAVKIGMLGTAELADEVSRWLAEAKPPLVVLDPVIVSTSGDRLLTPEGEESMRRLCTQADLITPNLAELGALLDTAPAADWAAALRQGEELARRTGVAVLVKGGHLTGDSAPDAIVRVCEGRASVTELDGARVLTSNTHGTGCSLSSALATLGAQTGGIRGAGQGTGAGGGTGNDGDGDGEPWSSALREAKDWLTGALRGADALDVGHGNGPIDHAHATRAALAAARVRTGASGPHDAAGTDADADAESFTASLWSQTRALRGQIDELDFVRALGDGSLEPAAFEHYLTQDLLYLSEYARCLARASQLAPSSDEQVFWARSAADALAEEARLHRARGAGAGSPLPSATTLAYVNHLHALAAVGDYGALVAGLLPCFWIYVDLGRRLAARRHPGHPFDDWLQSYGDPGFAEATETAVRITDRAARTASPGARETIRTAFVRSCEHEHAFFAQATAEGAASGTR
ncbi:bifunctional hydroxymethylpyrimidine kinase/phosphomethylpyrimidine kinase [Herbiconiux sp. 11R-BC]|uniref:bifunctional hydroxymethylpyrimidine kinase/phosphomethylpyrimidine kinase n=1 Tax=Herbiconiux sp. 11R-BC TaxID=3111637 RepID=UPI003C0D4F76